jgi:CDGSH-type Zn-finger protein
MIVDGDVKMGLCRHGQSFHEPLCDGAHQKVGFRDEEARATVVD